MMSRLGDILVTLMDWYDCVGCSFRHPWRAGERVCPNGGLTREEVLRVGDRMVIEGGRLVPRDQGERRRALARLRKQRQRLRLREVE